MLYDQCIFLVRSILMLIMVLCSQREPEEPEDATKGRDVFNEKPPADELLAASDIGKSSTTSLPDNVVGYCSVFHLWYKCAIVCILVIWL